MGPVKHSVTEKCIKRFSVRAHCLTLYTVIGNVYAALNGRRSLRRTPHATFKVVLKVCRVGGNLVLGLK